MLLTTSIGPCLQWLSVSVDNGAVVVTNSIVKYSSVRKALWAQLRADMLQSSEKIAETQNSVQ